MKTSAISKLNQLLATPGLITFRCGPRDVASKLIGELVSNELLRPCPEQVGSRIGIATVSACQDSGLAAAVNTTFKQYDLLGPVAEDTCFETNSHLYNHWIITKNGKPLSRLERIVAHGLEMGARTKCIYMDDLVPPTKPNMLELVNFAQHRKLALVLIVNLSDHTACAKDIQRYAHTTVDLSFSDSFSAAWVRVVDSTVVPLESFLIPYTHGAFNE